MDNFDLKQYLVENKLTYQEKMKEKAKKLKEESFINEEDETAAIKAAEKVEDQVASNPNIQAAIDKLSDEDKNKLSAQLAKLGITPDSSVKSVAVKIAPKIEKVINEAEGDIKKKVSSISQLLGQALVVQNAIPLLSLVIGRAINPAAPFTTGVGLTFAVGGALIGLAELLDKKLKEESFINEETEIETTAKKVADKIDDVLSPDEIKFLKQVYTQSGGKEKIAKAIDTKLEENINEALPEPPAEGDFGMSRDEIKLRQIIDKIIKKGTLTSMAGILPAAMAGQPGLAMGLGIAWLLGFLGKDAAWWKKGGYDKYQTGHNYKPQDKYGLKETEGTKGKEKEKEEPSKAPKDKSKQGPSSLNEGKVFFGRY